MPTAKSAAKKADEWFARDRAFSEPLKKLRKVMLDAGLEETVKWGMPCYMAAGQNVLGLGAFKNHFCIWFHQGALLDDPAGVLVNAQEGKTKAMRQWRMTDAKDVRPAAVARYVRAAMKNAEAGRKIPPAKPSSKSGRAPAELKAALAKDARTAAAFDALTAGQRREYGAYVADAKRADTKQRRIEKILPMIRKGAGLNDRYR